MSKLKYLGYIISDKGITIDSDKVKTITDMPAPKNVQ